MMAITELQVFKAEFFRVLGHPVRVRMLELLGDGNRTVGELRELIDIDSSSASLLLRSRNSGELFIATPDSSIPFSPFWPW